MKLFMDSGNGVPEFVPGDLVKTVSQDSEEVQWYLMCRDGYGYLLDGADGILLTIVGCWKVPLGARRVVAIYRPTGAPYGFTSIYRIINGVENPKDTIVWKAPEKVREFTVQELEKHFGCKVKIVGEEK